MIRTPDGTLTWAVSQSGFWKPGPHLELTAHFEYPEAAADLEQVVVVEADGSTSVYRIWDSGYTLEGITEILKGHGFSVRSVWNDLTGTLFHAESPTMGIVAVKE